MSNPIVLTVAYDGRGYDGYQIQKGSNTIQYQLELALKKAYGVFINTVAAGRTDAGVHAFGQVISFFPEGNKLPIENLPCILHRFLPQGIRVRSVRTEIIGFHARYSAKVRMYRYLLLREGISWNGWNSNISLDIFLIEKYLMPLIGYFDFSRLSCVKGNISTSREIFAIDVSNIKEGIYVDIYGNSFLKNMVRVIIGECIYAIRKKKDFNYFAEKVAYPQKNQKESKHIAPSCGLTLYSVFYKKIFGDRPYYRN